jgi:hypothetical protein
MRCEQQPLDLLVVPSQVLSREVVSIVEIFSKLGDSKKAEIESRIINCIRNIVDVLDVVIVNKLESKRLLISMPILACINSIDVHLNWDKIAWE